MRRIMITGGNGMLGHALQKEFNDCHLIIADIDNCDITDSTKFNSFVVANKPDVVIHCAAMTAVDLCETEVDKAYKLNAVGCANVAAACDKNNVRLIAISTDYVFKGDKDAPYNEYDIASPMNVYGKSKYAGELNVQRLCPNHVIARISWLYGEHGNSFVDTMIKLADGTRQELKVVNDQHGNPTSTTAVAKGLRQIVENDNLRGIFHLTCEGEATWYEFTVEIFKLMNIKQKVTPCKSDEFPRPATRPTNSRLDKMNLRLHSLKKMPDWKDALAEFLKEKS